MSGRDLVLQLAKRLSGVAILSSDITDEDLSTADLEGLIAYANSQFAKLGRPGIISKETIGNTVKKEEIAENAFERKFSSIAAKTPENFKARSVKIFRSGATSGEFAQLFSDRFTKLRAIIESNRVGKLSGIVKEIASTKQFMNGRDVSLIGTVYDKIVTKKGHVLITLEDGSGSAKVLFIRPEKGSSKELAELFNEALKIVNDETIGIHGRTSNPFIIANAIIRPDIPIHPKHRSETDSTILFMSDTHVGSKVFMEEEFKLFAKWLNGEVKYMQDVAEKTKYIIFGGDLIDGIGVYPGQERELSINDVYGQYEKFFEMFSLLPDYVRIFMITGNHDAVRRAEPQPELPSEFFKNQKPKNVTLMTNPSFVDIEGVKILCYHGTSLDSIIRNIPGCSYSRPEIGMTELLKRRHLSPIYGTNQVLPSKSDEMVIDEVPDIVHMGHVHKNGSSEYHGTLLINSGTWQAKTSLQIKLGHQPTPCIVPFYETKTMRFSSMDFKAIKE